MLLKKDTSFKIWIYLVIVYLFIRFLDILGISMLGSIQQNYVLYFVYALGLINALLFKKHISNKVIIFSFLFTIFSLISTIFFKKMDLNVFIYQTFWFLVFYLCSNNLETIKTPNFLKLLKIILPLTVIIYLAWILNFDGIRTSNINGIYYIVMLSPIIFIYEKKSIKYFTLIGIVLCLLLSVKRTAMIAVSLALFIPTILNHFKKSKNNKIKDILVLFFGISIFIIFSDYIINFIEHLSIWERFSLLAEDRGSGRIDIYINVLNAFKNSNVINILFGNGYNSVFLNGVAKTSAHNDFLEIIYDYGIISMIFYSLMLLYEIAQVRVLYKNNSNYSKIGISLIVVFIIVSFGSHLILYPTYFIYWIIMITICNKSVIDDRG